MYISCHLQHPQMHAGEPVCCIGLRLRVVFVGWHVKKVKRQKPPTTFFTLHTTVRHIPWKGEGAWQQMAHEWLATCP